MRVICYWSCNSKTSSHTTLNNCNLMNFLLGFKVVSSYCVTSLVISCNFLISFGDDVGFLFRTCNNLKSSLFNVRFDDCFSSCAGSKESSFVKEIFKISTCKSLSSFSYYVKVNVRTQWFVFGVNLKDLFTSLYIRIVYKNLSVKTSWS